LIRLFFSYQNQIQAPSPTRSRMKNETHRPARLSVYQNKQYQNHHITIHSNINTINPNIQIKQLLFSFQRSSGHLTTPNDKPLPSYPFDYGPGKDEPAPYSKVTNLSRSLSLFSSRYPRGKYNPSHSA